MFDPENQDSTFTWKKTDWEWLRICPKTTYAVQVQQLSSNSKEPVILQTVVSLCDMP